MRLYDADSSGERRHSRSYGYTPWWLRNKTEKSSGKHDCMNQQFVTAETAFLSSRAEAHDATETPPKTFVTFFSHNCLLGTIDFHATFPEMSKVPKPEKLFVDHARQKSSRELSLKMWADPSCISNMISSRLLCAACCVFAQNARKGKILCHPNFSLPDKICKRSQHTSL